MIFSHPFHNKDKTAMTPKSLRRRQQQQRQRKRKQLQDNVNENNEKDHFQRSLALLLCFIFGNHIPKERVHNAVTGIGHFSLFVQLDKYRRRCKS